GPRRSGRLNRTRLHYAPRVLPKALTSFAVASLVVACLPSCALIVDIHPRSAAVDACADCSNRSCGDEITACRADPECNVWFDCDRTCDVADVDCRAHCAAAAPPSTSNILVAVQQCESVSCGADCGAKCGGTPFLTAESSAAACSACITQKCCSESQACASVGDCWSIRACLRESGGPDRAISCVDAQHPTGSKVSH